VKFPFAGSKKPKAWTLASNPAQAEPAPSEAGKVEEFFTL
jgi:hypothetical protein